MNRRKFLSKSVQSAAALSFAGNNFYPSEVLGSNEKINFALIGCGGRGRFVARGLIEQGATLTYLCDLHTERLNETASFLTEVQSKIPKFVKDMEAAYDAKDVDAVVIATPDHWHGPASILACQAGKDVYVEKPHAHNIFESQKMKEAAKKYDRIIQVGTQNRSAPYNKAALEYVKSGQLGKIGLVKVYNLKPGKPFKLGEQQEKPDDFDWDKWCGPAPLRPYYQNIFKYGWHHFWDYSGGDLANDGIHQLDLAMMIMGDVGIPGKVSSTGARIVYFDDDAEIPDVQVVSYDFGIFILTLELTNYPRYMQKTTTTIRRNDEFPYWTQNATRVELYGSEFMMTIGRHGGGWQVTTSGGKVVEQMYGRPPDYDHYKNFLDCIKSRKQPNAAVEIAHPAGVMVHLGNIAHRVGNTTLNFDTKNENFRYNTQANKLVKREYRRKYAVPDKI
jgi:predicted dehydrogenase